MDQEELEGMIVERTARGESRSDIVNSVCRRTGLSWPAAEALVAEAYNERSQDIARRRLPLWLAISGAVLLAGLALLAATATDIAGLYHLFRVRQTTFSAAVTIYSLIVQAPLVWGQALLGVALIVGGALGLRQTLSEV